MKKISFSISLLMICAGVTLRAQTPCSTHATVVAGVECNLLQTATDLIMPCNAPTWVYALPIGEELWIDYTPGNCVSFCMQGSYSDITCATPDTTPACPVHATVVQGVECNLLQTATDLVMPCNAPSWVYSLPIGTELWLDYQPASCGSFCMQGTYADITCAEVDSLPLSGGICNTQVTVSPGIECFLLYDNMGNYLVPCQMPNWMWSLPPGSSLMIGYAPSPQMCNLWCPSNGIDITCVNIDAYSVDTICAGDSVLVGRPWLPNEYYQWLNWYSPVSCTACDQIWAPAQSNQVYTRLTWSTLCPTCPPDTSYHLVIVENCSGTTPHDDLQALRISPNPTTGLIRFDQPVMNGQISVLDINGRLVRSVSATQTESLDLSGLSAGIWILQIRTASGQRTEKVILTN